MKNKRYELLRQIRRQTERRIKQQLARAGFIPDCPMMKAKHQRRLEWAERVRRGEAKASDASALRGMTSKYKLTFRNEDF